MAGRVRFHQARTVRRVALLLCALTGLTALPAAGSSTGLAVTARAVSVVGLTLSPEGGLDSSRSNLPVRVDREVQGDLVIVTVTPR